MQKRAHIVPIPRNIRLGWEDDTKDENGGGDQRDGGAGDEADGGGGKIGEKAGGADVEQEMREEKTGFAEIAVIAWLSLILLTDGKRI